MLQEALINHGMTRKEAWAYLAWLELWPSPASRIWRSINESRVNAYAICQNLVKKKYATAIKTNNITHFNMIAPQQFLTAIESKLQAFESIMPDLVSLSSKSINKPKVRYFEWMSGLKNMFDEILLVSTDKIFCYLGGWTLDPRFKEYMDTDFIPKRIDKGIIIKAITTDTLADRQYNDTAKECLREMRVIPHKIDLSGEIIFYWGDKVAIWMCESDVMMWVTIQSEHFYNCQYSLFNLIRELTNPKD